MPRPTHADLLRALAGDPARDLRVTDADRANAATQVVAKFAGQPGKAARTTTAVSELMAARYAKQLEEA